MAALHLPHAEKSFWRDSYPGQAVFPTLTKDLNADVVIVGAGTTGNTTGKVTSQHSLIYADMARRLGRDTASAYAVANQAAVDTVREIIARERLDCDWQVDDNYIFTTNTKTVEKLKAEARTAADLGLPASFVKETPLPFKVRGAVKFTNQAKFNSQKYLLGLARAIDGDGSYVFENSKVNVFKDGAPAYVKTDRATVTAKNIIVATKIPSFPLAARCSYALLEYPTESFGIACKVDQNIPGMYISPDKQHHSILPIEVNGEQVMIFVGAGGNIPGVRLSKSQRYQLLADYAQKHFPVTSITHKWHDMDYFPYDSFPLVGKVYPWSRHMYQGTGYMKWGLTNGTAAGMMLHDAVTGGQNPWARYFNSERLRPVFNIPRAVVRHMVKR